MSDKLVVMGPRQVAEMLDRNPNAVLIDIRSSQEFLFIGHAKGAVHVPWIDEPDWVVDPHFGAHVRKVMLGGIRDDEEQNPPMAILMCRSGRRSRDAAELLIAEGLRNVYSVEGGFEGPLDEHHHRSTLAGWRFEGLPWEQC